MTGPRWLRWLRGEPDSNGAAAAAARVDAERKLRETRRLRPQVDRLAADIERALRGRA